MNSEILAIADEVATSLECQSNTSSHDRGSLPSPITLYRTGRVLFACVIDDSDDSSSIRETFEQLMSALPEEYLRTTLLHELHVAFASLILSFASTSSSSSAISSTPDTSFIHSMVTQVSNHVASPTSCSYKDIIVGTESLCGIYLSSETLCRCCGGLELTDLPDHARLVNELDILFASFCWIYEYLLSQSPGQDQNSLAIHDLKKCILKAMAMILVRGLLSTTTTTKSDEDEQLSAIMNVIQRLQLSGGESSAVGDMLHMEENQKHSFVNALSAKYSDGPQLQYTLAMLRGFPRSDSKPSASKPHGISHRSVLQEAKSKPQQLHQNMTDIQIGHVRNVLPDLGEGFIEEALKCYNNDVERTIDALLQISDDTAANHNIPPRLLTLPKNLPRKLKDLPDHYTANVSMHRGATAKEDGREHVERQKQYVKEAERRAEEEAYLVENVSRALGGLRVQEIGDGREGQKDFGASNNDNEYDDDYDDQYDGVGDDGGMAGGIGGLDEGLYDVDVHNVHQQYGARNEQDMWRQYNKLIKNVDAESQFWEETRNLNRQGGHKPSKSISNDQNIEEEGNDGDRKYRGPDKGRGGRLLGPDGKYLPIQRGGKKGGGRGSNASTPGDAANSGRGGRGGGGSDRKGRGAAGDSKDPHDNAKEGQKKDGDDLSKVQKRRKNDNKAKIGNHHRKDRATKKASGGMMF
ncbi:hypothetical protein ACHAW6_013364 [Cyclotella cf. meneghiniana]